MKLKKLVAVSVLTLALSIPQVSFAQEKLPQSVLNKLEAQENFVTNSIPELKAWETDLNGVTREVVPLSERVTTFAPPNDQYIYIFDHYDPDTTIFDWYFKRAGTLRVTNILSTPSNATYKQNLTNTLTWSVGTNISGTASVSAGFLGKIEVEVGITAERAQTWTANTEYGIQQEIPPRSVAYLTAWTTGVNSNGVLVYKKYAPGGTSQIGIYTEAAGGTVISKHDWHIEISETSPL